MDRTNEVLHEFNDMDEFAGCHVYSMEKNCFCSPPLIYLRSSFSFVERRGLKNKFAEYVGNKIERKNLQV